MQNIHCVVLKEREVPMIAEFLEKFYWKIPTFLKPVFRELVNKAAEPFHGGIHNIPQCDEFCECRGKGYFPRSPSLYHRGCFDLDNKNKKRQEKNVLKLTQVSVFDA